MRNYRQTGNVITLPAPAGGIISGAGYQAGQFFGVASKSADEGVNVEIQLTGVFDLPKASGEVWTPGELVYWDDNAKEASAVAGVRMLIGGAAADAAGGDATGQVRLNGAASPQVAEQSLFLFADDDAGLSTITAGLGAEDEGRLILVTARSGQGPQILHVSGGEANPLIGLSATVTIQAIDPAGIAVPIGQSAKVNIAEEIEAGVRNEFPAGAWDFTGFELTAPRSGYVRFALSIQFRVSQSCVVSFNMEEWDEEEEEWIDLGSVLAHEVASQTIPYHLTGFDEILATAGNKYRIVAFHDANATRTITVYKATGIANFVFSE